MIIGISGKIQSGKDTVGKIIQYLTVINLHTINNLRKTDGNNVSFEEHFNSSQDALHLSNWQIKRFGDKLKECASLILNIPREDLEKIEVKNSNLPEEWNYAKVMSTNTFSQPGRFSSQREASDYARDLRNAVAGSDFMAQSFNMTVRQFLQEFGTACRNRVHPNFWINALFSEYKGRQYTAFDPNAPIQGIPTEDDEVKYGHIETEYPNWIITDMRFPNELEAVKSREGITIRVNRFIGEYTDNHHSEIALDSANFDHVIDNNGSIEELIVKVKEILIKERII